VFLFAKSLAGQEMTKIQPEKYNTDGKVGLGFAVTGTQRFKTNQQPLSSFRVQYLSY